jgi:hypothetical protein
VQDPSLPPRLAGCQGRKGDGSACKATPRAGRGWCLAHDPDPAAEELRQRARAAGGRARGRRRTPEAPPLDAPSWGEMLTPSAALRGYTWTLSGVAAGRIEPKVANAIAVLLSGLVHTIEGSDLEKRIQALEAAGVAR